MVPRSGLPNQPLGTQGSLLSTYIECHQHPETQLIIGEYLDNSEIVKL
ncbi:hypothetical protein A2U01_0101982, partial [Trifolium medium]|nr:hypothetical protein [Trifolium medium]